MDALELLKQIAADSGYRFDTDELGVERMYRADGTLLLTANSTTPEAPLPANMPPDVSMGPDGVCFRTAVVHDRHGELVRIQARVCEDCWQIVPRYVDFPTGLTSPESDGDAGGNGAKTRLMGISESNKMGMAHLAKTVCLECYLAAFQRVYPNATAPELRPNIVGEVMAYVPDLAVMPYIPEPRFE